jgi:hypothetical protein
MSEHYITVGEFAILMVILCAPAILIGMVVQWAYFRRAQWFGSGRSLLVILSFPIAGVATLIIAAAVWLAIPRLASDVPDAASVSTYFFLPGILSALLVFPIVIAGVRKHMRGR